jgi:diguanylate cyclase (GGDEF)-like protein
MRDVSGLASRVGAAVSRDAAFDVLIAEVSRAFNTRACLFQRVDGEWRVLAQARGGLRASPSNVALASERFPSDRSIVTLDLREIGEGAWTWAPLSAPPEPPIALLLAEDWTASETLFSLATLLSSVLRSIRDRDDKRRAERLLVEEYALARRLSRLGGTELVAQRIVDQVSRSLRADVVSLALYQPSINRLVVTAAHGHGAAALADIRVEPRSWVIGHVYSSGRPVLVSDVRRIREAPQRRPQYRTFSFAAVPVLADGHVIGVLSATDKRDGSVFDRQDLLTLRTYSASAALALMAASRDTEVHRLAYAATVDALTGLFNRTYLDVRLLEEVERAKRGSSPLTLLMADIDGFKLINDTHGHQMGDAVLQAVASTARSAVRVFDVCARYGGDEFAILMPSSDHASAVTCAERIRQRVADYLSDGDAARRLPPITISIGVAVIDEGDAPADLVGRADRCLYKAKARGKNCVCLSSNDLSVARLSAHDTEDLV